MAVSQNSTQVDVHNRSSLPNSPGVYHFYDEKKAVLYVGKAKRLRTRVLHYFQSKRQVSTKIAQLVPQIVSITYYATRTEFDAMLLEAEHIRAHKPKYNSISKDDKSALYILISISERLPHIRFVRKRALPGIKKKSRDVIFGPFQSATIARNLMKTIRTIVPYCQQTKRTGKPCFYTHIGLCDPCPSVIAHMTDPTHEKEQRRRYRTHILRIRDILSGKGVQVIRTITRQMKSFAKSEAFEDAARLKKQLDALSQLLEYPVDPQLYGQYEDALAHATEKEHAALTRLLSRYYAIEDPISRIECYDISNTAQFYATGSMVVFADGKPDTNEYRRFRVRLQKISDTAMMAEVLTRRLTHPEWGKPDLIVVDGGKGQVGAVRDVLLNHPWDIPLIGIAKRREELVIPEENGFAVLRISRSSPALHIVQRVRDEAHRFAQAYHKKLRTAGMYRTKKGS